MRRLLDDFVHVSPADEVVGPVPHGEPCGGVVEEDALVARPHHAPAGGGGLGSPLLTDMFTHCTTMVTHTHHTTHLQGEGGLGSPPLTGDLGHVHTLQHNGHTHTQQVPLTAQLPDIPAAQL